MDFDVQALASMDPRLRGMTELVRGGLALITDDPARNQVSGRDLTVQAGRLTSARFK